VLWRNGSEARMSVPVPWGFDVVFPVSRSLEFLISW
jgi:hypothetical protein